jgi:hypothetical protein
MWRIQNAVRGVEFSQGLVMPTEVERECAWLRLAVLGNVEMFGASFGDKVTKSCSCVMAEALSASLVRYFHSIIRGLALRGYDDSSLLSFIQYY